MCASFQLYWSSQIAALPVVPDLLLASSRAGEECVARHVECREDGIGTDALHRPGAFESVAHLTAYIRQAEADASCRQFFGQGFEHFRCGDVQRIDGASIQNEPFNVRVAGNKLHHPFLEVPCIEEHDSRDESVDY